MILKAKERGDGGQLARYLLATRDNEHVELHEIKGFMSDDLIEAFHEADAIARGTRCKNYLFSMSLNPPEDAQVSTEVFERTADAIGEKLGLENQPRAIVLHEKDGRRHAHVVWSRIDTDRMRAINLPHYKSKLKDISRDLFLEQGWDMPRGLQDRSLRDPQNFTREEWQQAKRVGLDPREIKTALKQCWEESDNRTSFESALKEHGFRLAKGDRRGFVAVDYKGEVYSLSRYAGLKTKEIQDRLGKPNLLPSVQDVQAEVALKLTPKLQTFIQEIETKARQGNAMIEFRRSEMTAHHKNERNKLWAAHEKRWLAESNQRAERMPRGFSGIWHRLTGQYANIKSQNEREVLQAWHRDRDEKDALIFKQIEEREMLQREIKKHRERSREELMQLRADVAEFDALVQRQREHEIERQRRRDQSVRRGRNLEP